MLDATAIPSSYPYPRSALSIPLESIAAPECHWIGDWGRCKSSLPKHNRSYSHTHTPTNKVTLDHQQPVQISTALQCCWWYLSYHGKINSLTYKQTKSKRTNSQTNRPTTITSA